MRDPRSSIENQKKIESGPISRVLFTAEAVGGHYTGPAVADRLSPEGEATYPPDCYPGRIEG